jgi:hypothetical protein
MDKSKQSFGKSFRYNKCLAQALCKWLIRISPFLRRDLLVGETNQLDKVKTQLEEILKTMQFGSVTLVVQDGKIIQIEKNEKIRLGK